MSNLQVNVTEPVNFRLNKEMIENLKRIARHVAYHKNEEHTYVDLIRILLAYHFPNTTDEKELSLQCESAMSICEAVDKKSASWGYAKIPTVFTTTSYSYGVTTTTGSGGATIRNHTNEPT
jgi:hypothetical protein